jgi:uncharacterized protein (TIGR02646 family)
VIRRDRSQVAEPAALSKPYPARVKPPKEEGKTEREAVLAAFAAHVAAGKSPVDFQFPFERYQEEEVKRALRQLFDGKCAYCESNYSGTQPMDVEHWRPKGEVHLDDGTKLPGYYWLAAEWSNLFPSCIDCNRARTQLDVVDKKEVRLGKANQFPVEGARLPTPEADPDREKPLILNPCKDDPVDFFRYTEDGAVLPRDEKGEGRRRALESIRVYALNRSDLVAERLAVRRLVDHRLNLIAQLGTLRESIARPEDEPLREAVADLIANEMDALLSMTRDGQVYAGMVRQMIREADL